MNKTCLAEMAVENLAVIGAVRLSVTSGFVALTGETGVGKSLLIDALRLLAGGRASSRLVREGADRAVVEGVFRNVSSDTLAPLREAGVVEAGDGPADELVVRRVIGADGHSAAYVNDRRVGLSLLAEVGDRLVDILGQHAQRSLLSESTHGRLLDAAENLDLSTYRAVYERLGEVMADIHRIENDRQEAEARAALLRFALEEIGNAAPEVGEDDQLADELSRLAHAERLRELSEQVYDDLYGSEPSILTKLSSVSGNLSEIAGVSAGQAGIGKLVAEAEVLLGEAAEQVRGFRDQALADPGRQAEVEARLALLESLKRKYGRTLDEVIESHNAFQKELEQGGDVAERLERLEQERQSLLADLTRQAASLTAARTRGAASLARAVESGLALLAMPHARFTVELIPLSDGIPAGERLLGPDGAEQVRFLLAANPGEGAQPLAKVASGGEMSRIMLAIKMTLIDADPVPCLVFDEVDAGIGGSVAEQVGRMLAALGRRHQVFCVTHLAQIASLADSHLQVEKWTDGERTHARVTPLDADTRVTEVARMLGGRDLTDTTVAHAREMLAADAS
ncbi:MAG: DNA repair protein RecN [Leptospirillia bacterium]